MIPAIPRAARRAYLLRSIAPLETLSERPIMSGVHIAIDGPVQPELIHAITARWANLLGMARTEFRRRQ